MHTSSARMLIAAFALLALLGASISAAAAAPLAQTVTPSITAADQQIINNTVVCAEVVAAVDGWLAVHAFQADGKLIANQVVGSSPVKAGTNTNVAVTLNESFNPGDSLVFMLHVDEDPAGSLDFPGSDGPVLVNDQIVLTQFRVLGAGQPATMPNTGIADEQTVSIGLIAAFMVLGGLLLRRRSRMAPGARN